MYILHIARVSSGIRNIPSVWERGKEEKKKQKKSFSGFKVQSEHSGLCPEKRTELCSRKKYGLMKVAHNMVLQIVVHKFFELLAKQMLLSAH